LDRISSLVKPRRVGFAGDPQASRRIPRLIDNYAGWHRYRL